MISKSRDDFIAGLGFGVDEFQLEAFDVLDEGRNVLVSAPTGSGKTLVATYAIDKILREGGRAFYTTPLKALSNQKFTELGKRFGEENVGLLTGDTSINRGATVVVMTTEVLRNMLLTESGRVQDLSLVIMDEVHYLQDPYRGGVWEEVIILTPSEVQFVALSATVANAQFVGEWLSAVRGETAVIIEQERPITLHNHVAIQRRGQYAPELVDLLDGDRLADQARKVDALLKNSRKFRPGPQWRGSKSSAPPSPYSTPRRSDLLRVIDDEDLGPTIYFIFSRAGCDEAVRQCRRDGVRFTTREMAFQIDEISMQRVSSFEDDDLNALGYPEFHDSLRNGVAAHHAGMVPAFREIVEACFERNLLGVVFATETLALGVNMPARSVVLEKFAKYSDAGRNTLSSGEFAQMTGRAGRRGLDDEGHAIVSFALETSMADIARVALAPAPDLHSSFRPTYNFTANLIHHFDEEMALTILQRSYAQFEADRRPAGARRPLADQMMARRNVFEDLGYAQGWKLTTRGEALRSVYHENDLLLCEAWYEDAFMDIEPATLAAVLSCFAFEGRRAKPKPAAKGTNKKKPKDIKDRLGPQRRADIVERLALISTLHTRVVAAEERYKVKHAKGLDDGFARAIASWARGASLSTALDVADAEVGVMAPGDFVRHAKQVADLCEQVSRLAPKTDLAAVAQEAKSSILRSVVAGSMGIPQLPGSAF